MGKKTVPKQNNTYGGAMEDYKKKLEVQLKQLNSLIKQSNKNIAKYKDIGNGQIHISRCRGNWQYYCIDKALGIRQYMGAAQEKIIRKYIQKDYELTLNKKIAKFGPKQVTSEAATSMGAVPAGQETAIDTSENPQVSDNLDAQAKRLAGVLGDNI